ncbi:MAG: hypothetical protein WC325_08165 [Candidatus Bathyarchaeia archaeon]|jgi:phage terminase large subunit GpA-like protein
MEPPLIYQVDLKTLEGEGDFPCPCCGTIISPEDETEDVYTILDTVVAGDDLESLVIECNHCKSQIRLTGFSV